MGAGDNVGPVAYYGSDGVHIDGKSVERGRPTPSSIGELQFFGAGAILGKVMQQVLAILGDADTLSLSSERGGFRWSGSGGRAGGYWVRSHRQEQADRVEARSKRGKYRSDASSFGAVTKLFFEATAGGTLRKFTLKL